MHWNWRFTSGCFKYYASEKDGYDVTVLNFNNNQKLVKRFEDALVDLYLWKAFKDQYLIHCSIPIQFVKSGMWDISKAQSRWKFPKCSLAIRQDITFKILTEGVIQDEDGDMVQRSNQDMLLLELL